MEIVTSSNHVKSLIDNVEDGRINIDKFVETKKEGH